MVVYDLLCSGGHRHEVTLKSMFSDNPSCGECGAETTRVPGLARISGIASPGPSRDDMPNTWKGIDRGDPDTIRHWHKAMTRREKLECSYPELAGDRRPVLAHEGAFADKPLRAGDPLAETVARATFGKPAAPPPGSAAPDSSADSKGTPA